MADAIKPSACVVVFGVRFLSAERIDKDADPRATAAKKHGLFVECGRRYPPPEAGGLPSNPTKKPPTHKQRRPPKRIAHTTKTLSQPLD